MSFCCAFPTRIFSKGRIRIVPHFAFGFNKAFNFLYFPHFPPPHCGKPAVFPRVFHTFHGVFNSGECVLFVKARQKRREGCPDFTRNGFVHGNFNQLSQKVLFCCFFTKFLEKFYLCKPGQPPRGQKGALKTAAAAKKAGAAAPVPGCGALPVFSGRQNSRPFCCRKLSIQALTTSGASALALWPAPRTHFSGRPVI